MVKMGKAARESVRLRFLLPRLALDYLNAAILKVHDVEAIQGRLFMHQSVPEANDR
jgi:hypothetical protein